jgi:hypothetical protein
LVPFVVDGVDKAVIGTVQSALKLQIIRRVGKDEVDGASRELYHFGDAIAEDDPLL